MQRKQLFDSGGTILHGPIKFVKTKSKSPDGRFWLVQDYVSMGSSPCNVIYDVKTMDNGWIRTFTKCVDPNIKNWYDIDDDCKISWIDNITFKVETMDDENKYTYETVIYRLQNDTFVGIECLRSEQSQIDFIGAQETYYVKKFTPDNRHRFYNERDTCLILLKNGPIDNVVNIRSIDADNFSITTDKLEVDNVLIDSTLIEHIENGIKNLHKLNISHNDVHPRNVGWDKTRKRWCLFDFDFSSFLPDAGGFFANEDFLQLKSNFRISSL